MSKQIKILKEIREILSKKTTTYYTIEEKKEMALRGESVPICISDEKEVTEYIVPIHQFIPIKRRRKNNKKMKL